MDDNQKHGMSKPKPLTDAISLSLKTGTKVTKDAKKIGVASQANVAMASTINTLEDDSWVIEFQIRGNICNIPNIHRPFMQIQQYS